MEVFSIVIRGKSMGQSEAGGRRGSVGARIVRLMRDSMLSEERRLTEGWMCDRLSYRGRRGAAFMYERVGYAQGGPAYCGAA
jgi:hypothetical protein